MSTANLITLADENRHQDLFLHELNWNAPDHPPVSVTAAAGETHTVTNVASYRGIRVWACDGIPGSRTEAEIDRAIAKTTTDRLVIFHNEAEQVWRWPARRSTDNANATRLTRHRHRNGNPDPPFESRLAAIQLPLDREIDANTLLTRVRDAFDIEARNESRRASKLMARMYTALERAYPHNADRPKLEHEISVTLARILFLMFGDDTEMWEPDGEPDAFRDFIHRETTPDGATLAEQLNDLFADLNNATVARTVPYINGGLFNEPVTIPPLDREFRDAVLDACAVDWSTISPAIFGSMFQSVRDAQTRRELGEHYTAEDNILKTLNPLFLDELRAEFGTARDHPDAAKLLNKLWKKLGEIRYMDPACGCGNFIIVAYRELRDLELQIMEQLQELGGDNQLSFDPTLSLKVTLDHFHGIEVDEWPARIAETAMFLTNRQCDLKLKQRFGEAPRRLPIQTQTRIVVQSALTLDWETVMPAGVNSIIAGNPPFLGISQRTAQQTAELQAVWGTGYHGTLDYVTGWYAKAVDYFSNHDGLWAFVSTNSVLQGEAVAPLFRRITEHKWRIKFAHRTFPWTSEAAGRAAVHCIIIGFAKKVAEPRLFDYPSAGAAPVERAGVTNITPYLTDGPTYWSNR
ncbi:class I SAM-dependent DNA methyltransferase [Mycolicibacterium frederiksbergense]|uniref:site-specific DNA-methyltransferase (adenine-specific) n=1 Tax=Mycolicibacterium frederiksbergense TaxID=117567 RepID=A0A6H0S0R8_9MYCO|nr:class I SAM-dependent DNA methyltransferase [Mycolicibacterium frederiksbergense]QIV79637.1 class I SAM-dependent DNA methyltransferase [Mycolicibacterium frederiksbergense]